MFSKNGLTKRGDGYDGLLKNIRKAVRLIIFRVRLFVPSRTADLSNKGCVVVLNSFTGVNHLSPLLMEWQRVGIKVKVVIVEENLQDPGKDVFLGRVREIIGFEWIKYHEYEVLKSGAEFGMKYRNWNGWVVGVSPSLLALMEKGLLVKPWRRHGMRIMAVDYFGECTRKIQRQVDLIVLSSPVWNAGYIKRKVHYGLPYWDSYIKRNDVGVLNSVAGCGPVVIPEIVQDGDSWYEDCFRYISEKRNAGEKYVLKYRLKRENLLYRNRRLESRLGNRFKIEGEYSPYFFTNVQLLQSARKVVFTSNATLYILDCMAAGAPVEKAFVVNRYNIWFDKWDRECALALDSYIKDPERTRKRFIVRRGNNSKVLIERMEKISAICPRV
jgi:hypothetical protein